MRSPVELAQLSLPLCRCSAPGPRPPARPTPCLPATATALACAPEGPDFAPALDRYYAVFLVGVVAWRVPELEEVT